MPDPLVPFPEPPARVFLVGIGGIGVSGLAQLLAARGYAVAGSDRALDDPGRTRLFDCLRRQGIALYPQDGTGPASFQPHAVVASSAVEEGNPDFRAAGDALRFSRAAALSILLRREEPARLIAIAGSCGKTTVTAWLTSALRHLGRRVLCVCGGFMAEAETDTMPGNFVDDPDPEFLVAEVDESDKSLVEFAPDVGVLLNIGTDHYDRSELERVFALFLDRCGEGLVLAADLAPQFAEAGPLGRVLFGAEGPGVAATAYVPGPDGMSCTLTGVGTVRTRQFGRHSAENAAAVAATLAAIGVLRDTPPADVCRAIGAFAGVRQRFERMGDTADGIPVYNDYAHNAEKIRAALQTVREAAPGPVLAVFQPHGYGPLGFMRESLRNALRDTLTEGDRFLLLPVFYAGGTTSFSPTSEEVAADFRSVGLPVVAVPHRTAVLRHRQGMSALLVMGARDPSLRTWSMDLCLTIPPKPTPGRGTSGLPEEVA